MKTKHTQDADCQVDEVTMCCKGCGVEHGEGCMDCGGRGFHKPACAQQTLTLTPQTIHTARVALLATANTHADEMLQYIARGWSECAAYAAQRAYHNTIAWHELAFAV